MQHQYQLADVADHCEANSLRMAKACTASFLLNPVPATDPIRHPETRRL